MLLNFSNNKNPLLLYATMNLKIDTFLSNAKIWQQELTMLRNIILDCGLVEELKWGQPCYTFNKKNVLILGEFKDFCVLSFFKGILLQDTQQLLIKQGENTQSARILKFTNIKQIIEIENIIKAYIFEAIEIEKAGLKVAFSDKEDLVYIDELKAYLAKDNKLKTAFEALTTGRKRAYNMFFADAKHSATRTARIEKYASRILIGKGMNDCVCGLSKRMPNCDGSHKFIKG